MIWMSKEEKETTAMRTKALKRRIAAGNLDSILFSDEKLFTVEQSSNHQNDRILSAGIEDIPENLKYVPRRQGAESLMVWAGVSANSRTKLVFVPAGVKINIRRSIGIGFWSL